MVLYPVCGDSTFASTTKKSYNEKDNRPLRFVHRRYGGAIL